MSDHEGCVPATKFFTEIQATRQHAISPGLPLLDLRFDDSDLCPPQTAPGLLRPAVVSFGRRWSVSASSGQFRSAALWSSVVSALDPGPRLDVCLRLPSAALTGGAAQRPAATASDRDSSEGRPPQPPASGSRPAAPPASAGQHSSGRTGSASSARRTVGIDI